MPRMVRRVDRIKRVKRVRHVKRDMSIEEDREWWEAIVVLLNRAALVIDHIPDVPDVKEETSDEEFKKATYTAITEGVEKLPSIIMEMQRLTWPEGAVKSDFYRLNEYLEFSLRQYLESCMAGVKLFIKGKPVKGHEAAAFFIAWCQMVNQAKKATDEMKRAIQIISQPQKGNNIGYTEAMD